MELKPFLELAARLSASLGDVHQRGAIHGHIGSHSLQTEPTTGRLGLATAPSVRDVDGLAEAVLARADLLPYVSPEMTGRMNRSLDHRTDLYSLGALLYELLAGSPPFHASDLLEWIHCHVARSARPLSEVAPSLPVVVSDIVKKLLAKTPEDRYQSARGLTFDIEQCLAVLEKTGRVDPFVLASRDVSDRFQVAPRLYGRDGELAALFRGFDKVVESGVPSLALVTGHSGIGKSSLVNELQRPIVRARGAFIGGKFDQYKRDVPYATIVQAFSALVRQLLAESNVMLASWRKRLEDALGGQGQLIIDVIPQIELIIGKQAAIEPLPVSEAQNRFNRVFHHFVCVFAQREHPLVLFLDDLQWADTASIKLLQHVLTHPQTRHLFVLGAYRDSEVTRAHPWVVAVDEIAGSGVPLHRISLDPLAEEDTRRIIVDTVRRDDTHATALAGRVHAKTGGNPFFVTQLLRTLHENGLVQFDRAAMSWSWDIAAIDAADVAGDAAGLLDAKLRRLGDGTRDALRLGACIGNEFSIDALASIVGVRTDKLREHLREASREGLLQLGPGSAKFHHDRVQQAAYALIPEQERAEIHLRIGRLLYPRRASSQELFDLVNQLNLGASLVSAPEERTRIAELNLEAGRKAKASSAHKSAANYFAAGASMLGGDCWTTHPDLAYALHFERAECEQQNGNSEEADRLCSLVLERTTTLLHKLPAFRVKIELRTSQYSPDTIPCILECLRLIDPTLTGKPDDALVNATFEELWSTLGDRPIEALLELPPMVDEEMQAAMSVLPTMYAAAWFMDENLGHLTVLRMALLSMRHGNADGSSLGYAALGMALIKRWGDSTNAYRFSKVGADLAERSGSAYWQGMAYNIAGAMVSVWTRPIGEGLDYARKALAASIESGNLIYSAFNSLQVISYSLVKGEPLEPLHRLSEPYLETVRATKFVMVDHAMVAHQRFIRAMQGQTRSLTSFASDDFDAAAFEATIGDGRSPLAVLWYYTLLLASRFLAGDIDGALEAAAVKNANMWAASCQLTVPQYHLYAALALATKISASGAPHLTKALRAELDGHARELATFAKDSPENFAHKHSLVAAEIARLDGRDDEAMKLYDEAIRAANEHGFWPNEAISSELAARFYFGRGLGTVGRAFVRRAARSYARWGATAQVSRLEQQYEACFVGEAETAPRARR